MTTLAPPRPRKPEQNPASLPLRARPPLLISGDHLSRKEFERRYEAHPDLKAELIEGVVYVSSPVHLQNHAKPHSRIVGWLFYYQSHTPGIDLADNPTLHLDWDNEVQPDVALWVMEGKAYATENDYMAGAPELIVEVAASSATHDLHEKLHIYRRNGVQEYLVLTVYEQGTYWFALVEGEYKRLEPDENGVIHSQIFPGLYFSPALFWADDMPALLALLQQGLSSPEHQTFKSK